MRKKVGEKVGKAKKWRRAMRGAGGGKVTVFCWVIIILAEVAAMPEVIKFGKAFFSRQINWGSRQTNRIFYGQAEGKGASAPSVLTVSKCDNFDPFFSLKFDSLILKTHFISL